MNEDLCPDKDSMKCFFVIWLLTLSQLMWCQDTDTDLERLSSLIHYKHELLQKKDEIFKESKKQISIQDKKYLDEYDEEIKKLDKKIYHQITGLKSPNDKKQSQKELGLEIQDLIQPLITSIKRLTQDARHLENIREKLHKKTTEITQLHKANEKVDLIKSTALIEDYGEIPYIKAQIQKSLKQLEFDKVQLQMELKHIDKNAPNMLTRISVLFKGFIKTTGKNILLSFMAFLITLGFLILLRIQVIKSNFLYIPHWARRPIELTYNTFVVLLSILMSLAALYFLNDWTLFSLGILFLLGLAWSLKSALPQFFEQIKLVMNLGTIREGEIVIWKGIRFKIDSLAFYCKISNPWLNPSTLRINITDLGKNHSRPLINDEKWFPSQIGHWVSLSTGAYGQVLYQDVHSVILMLIDKTQLTLKTEQFLELGPTNYSYGMVLEIVLPLNNQDYDKYSYIKELIQTDLLKAMLPYDISQDNIEILPDQINKESWDLSIRVHFNGKWASLKERLNKELTSSCLQTISQNNISMGLYQIQINTKEDQRVHL